MVADPSDLVYSETKVVLALSLEGHQCPESRVRQGATPRDLKGAIFPGMM